MAAENFARSMPHILAYEGKFSDHPNDPGGKTYEGITQRVWDGYARNRGLTPKTLSKATGSWPDWPKYRNDIYRKQYWDAVRGDHLPGGVDFVVFDGAVNSGPSQSAKWLQRALGNVKVDGVIGEATVAAARAHKDHDALIADICFQRMNFLRALKTWKSFGTGWTRRVDAVRKTGQAWARGSVGPMPVAFTAPAAEKAVAADAATQPGSAAAGAAVGAGASFGGVAVAIEAARDALAPVATSSEIVQKVMAGLVIASVVLTVGGLIWKHVNDRRAAKIAEAVA